MKITEDQYLAQPITVVDDAFFPIGTKLQRTLRKLALLLPGELHFGCGLVHYGWYLQLHQPWPRIAVRAAILIVMADRVKDEQETATFRQRYAPVANL